jgi:hypothetical protein
MSVRFVPWILALAGLAVPLVASGFVVWPLIAVWLAILALIWSVGRAGLVLGPANHVAAAIALLPLLFALAFEGGLFLIPADIAWLVIELADRRRVTGQSGSRDATA